MPDERAIEKVVLVDPFDNDRGEMEKLEAHKTGVLHRAFSVFLFNSQGAALLHQRNHSKYHSGGLWTNACCGHPKKSVPVIKSAESRLNYEMGIAVPLTFLWHFTYRSELPNGLIEHEIDHVFVGEFDGIPHPHVDEIADWRYVDQSDLEIELQTRPEIFTTWFRIAYPLVVQNWTASSLSRLVS